MLEELLRSWDGEEVVVRFDRPTGTWMFVCIHSTSRGPAGGGTRMKVYAEPADALADAMRLAEAMTLKMGAVDMPFGGGKAVLAVPELLGGEARRGLLLRYADLVTSLRGTFHTGPDVNTSVTDMDVIGERCPYVFCRSEERGGSGDPGPQTARGVFHGIRASVRHVLGTDSLEGRVVLVQGLGSVGAPLAEQLAAAGARVLVSDVLPERAESFDAEAVPAEAVIGTECDVYAPCALGGTLNAETIPRLRCRIVAGSANNQLAELEDAERLRDAGILYAPDFVINAGGVLHSLGTEHLGWTREQIEERFAAIGDALTEVYSKAETEGTTTEAAAEQLARTRL
ncbi:MAG TPA: Glu/Leu/Phe/Val dehydrogenase dimerization domain-containing protein [Gaiellaceae bacterium]|nr:Glu/Leu/Phe/Val dehydrogenase dimerization domain-containing protein [Gaiellaceae bacterium]